MRLIGILFIVIVVVDVGLCVEAVYVSVEMSGLPRLVTEPRLTRRAGDGVRVAEDGGDVGGHMMGDIIELLLKFGEESHEHNSDLVVLCNRHKMLVSPQFETERGSKIGDVSRMMEEMTFDFHSDAICALILQC